MTSTIGNKSSKSAYVDLLLFIWVKVGYIKKGLVMDQSLHTSINYYGNSVLKFLVLNFS
jgi:hypothetical protein